MYAIRSYYEYFSLIVLIASALSLTTGAIANYLKKHKQQAIDRQTERKFLQFRQSCDGLFDANNRALQEKHLTAFFTKEEIDFLVRSGYVLVKSYHVF